jgi:hypothetical protein
MLDRDQVIVGPVVHVESLTTNNYSHFEDNRELCRNEQSYL